MDEAPQPSSKSSHRVRRPPSSGDSGASSPPPSASTGPQPSSAAKASSAAEFRLWTLADAPVHDDAADRLGYGDIADGLARLIDGEETATPLTIALSAPWGAGKTSLLRLVEDRVVRQRVDRHEAPTIMVWFNAWMHDAAPNLSGALAADIARHATRCRDRWTRLRHPLPSSMLSPKERARRRFWLGAVALITSIALYLLVSLLIVPAATRRRQGPGGLRSLGSGLVCAAMGRQRPLAARPAERGSGGSLCGQSALGGGDRIRWPKCRRSWAS